MSTLASLKTQAAQAACFTCIPVNTQEAIKAYLLAKIAGGSLDPKTLLNQARSFFGVQSGFLPAFQAVFASYMIGGGGVISPTLLRCDISCLTPQLSASIQLASFARAAGGSTDPKTLARLAACFVCIPTGQLIALQTYLMGVIAGVITVPPLVGPAAAIPPNILRQATTGMALPPTVLQAYLDDAIAAVACPVPIGLTGGSNGDGTITVIWNAVPSGVLLTDVRTSSDNITFGLAATIVAPGTSATVTAIANPTFVKVRFCTANGCCAFSPSIQVNTPPLNPLTTTWLNNITTNGGPAPSITTKTAINTFFNAIDACGITSKILDLCMFVPDNLIAARTPLIAGSTNPWTNFNFVGGDLTVNGLAGNGATKYLDPGFVPAFAGPQFTLTSCCLFFYAYTANSTASGTELGTNDGGNDSFFVSNFITAGIGTLSDLLGGIPRLLAASPGNGFYMASRIANNNNKIYFANSGTAWSAIASNGIGSSGIATTGYLVFANNNNGVPNQPCNSVLSCVGFAAGLTTTEGQCLYNAVQACRVALGGGFR